MTTAIAPKPATYVMPKVAIGDVILWAHDRTRMDDPVPGLVTRVGTEAIGLIFFPPDSRAGTPRDGVRFHLDPANARISSDAGVFDLGPDRKRLDMIEVRLAAIEPALTRLMK